MAKKTKCIHRRTYHAVIVVHKDGTPVIANGPQATPYLFPRRKDALDYRRELASHLKSTGSKVSVVKATSEITVEI